MNLSIKNISDDIDSCFRRVWGRVRTALIKDKYPNVVFEIKNTVETGTEKLKIIATGKIVSLGKVKDYFAGWPKREIHRYATV